MTTNFPLHELTLSDYAVRHGIDNTPVGEAVANLRILAEGLERARTVLGNFPLFVTSGYRSPVINAAVGGSRYSYHQRGLAADFIMTKVTPYKACLLLQDAVSFVDYDKIIHEYGRWVHIQFQDAEVAPRREAYTIRTSRGGYLPGILEV